MKNKTHSVSISCSEDEKNMISEMKKRAGYKNRSKFILDLFNEIYRENFSKNKGNTLFEYTGKKKVASLLNSFKKGI